MEQPVDKFIVYVSTEELNSNKPADEKSPVVVVKGDRRRNCKSLILRGEVSIRAFPEDPMRVGSDTLRVWIEATSVAVIA